jgi:hypothetical protein
MCTHARTYLCVSGWVDSTGGHSKQVRRVPVLTHLKSILHTQDRQGIDSKLHKIRHDTAQCMDDRGLHRGMCTDKVSSKVYDHAYTANTHIPLLDSNAPIWTVLVERGSTVSQFLPLQPCRIDVPLSESCATVDIIGDGIIHAQLSTDMQVSFETGCLY